MSEPSHRDEELRALCSRLGLDLRGFSLLDRALTHASALGDVPELPGNNESLEFLGDAVLGLAVAEWLYERVPNLSPGEYTQMRARVVNRLTLAGVAQRLDIGQAVRLSRGEEASGGRERPGLLADCLEAVVGSVFLEAGWGAARDFAVRILEDELKAAPGAGSEWDYRSQLQKYCQGRQWPLPVFDVVSESGPDHQKTFQVEVKLCGRPAGTGRGTTKKQAEQNAAKAALESQGQR
jgi:ribonuclease-3